MTRALHAVAFLCGVALFVYFVLDPAEHAFAGAVAFACIGAPAMAILDRMNAPLFPVKAAAPCTGEDLCPCYSCTVRALKPEDRQFLKRHGWNDVIRQPAATKRTPSQVAVDRELRAKADDLALKVRAASSHTGGPYAVRIQTGSTTRRPNRLRP